MSGFRFSLEKVRHLRQAEEESRARTVADRRREADGARAEEAQLESARDQSLAQVRSVHGAGGAVGHLQNLEYVLERLDEHIQVVRSRRREAEEDLVQSIDEYTDALRRRQAIEKLRERRLALWKRQQQRLEQAATDEVALTRHQRGAVGGES
ncbi:MAG: hypothetical protein D6701_01595 [Gemmatimonadetes bacterium]|nr:MAG: hypothetical protein D6701_01595 [Gemmatimonadota bacterium]